MGNLMEFGFSKAVGCFSDCAVQYVLQKEYTRTVVYVNESDTM